VGLLPWKARTKQAGSIVSVVAYVRTVKTASGARAVQIVHSQHRGSRDIEHIGSAHSDTDLEVLKHTK
jgi:hypothetical protein